MGKIYVNKAQRLYKDTQNETWIKGETFFSKKNQQYVFSCPNQTISEHISVKIPIKIFPEGNLHKVIVNFSVAGKILKESKVDGLAQPVLNVIKGSNN